MCALYFLILSEGRYFQQPEKRKLSRNISNLEKVRIGMWEQGGGHTSLLTGATGRKLDYHSSPSILIIPLADQVHV